MDEILVQYYTGRKVRMKGGRSKNGVLHMVQGGIMDAFLEVADLGPVVYSSTSMTLEIIYDLVLVYVDQDILLKVPFSGPPPCKLPVSKFSQR